MNLEYLNFVLVMFSGTFRHAVFRRVRRLTILQLKKLLESSWNPPLTTKGGRPYRYLFHSSTQLKAKQQVNPSRADR